MRRLDRPFFDRSPEQVAEELLGAVIATEVEGEQVAVRLTEVEAYLGARDPSSHAYRGRTSRNAVMFGEPGLVYVYFSYGMHWCMNLVCSPSGEAGAVLLRAGEVITGGVVAERRRTVRTGRAVAARDLARGPARLCQALGVTGALNGTDTIAAASPVQVRSRAAAPDGLANGPRTGVSGEGASLPLRFWLPAETTVSPYRAAVRRARG